MNTIYEYYKDCLRFEGRLARLEYLQRTLALVIMLIFISTLVVFLNSLNFESIAVSIFLWSAVIAGIIFGIYSILANIALNICRLHDINLSGWWVLGIIIIELITTFLARSLLGESESVSVIGSVVSISAVLFYFLMPGTKGENNYDLGKISQPLPKQKAIEKEEVVKVTKKAPAKKKTVAKKTATKEKTTAKKTVKKSPAKKVPAKKKAAVKKKVTTKKTTKTKGTK